MQADQALYPRSGPRGAVRVRKGDRGGRRAAGRAPRSGQHDGRAPGANWSPTRTGDFRRCGWRFPIGARPVRPRGLRPGFRIYLLEEGGYRESEESRAFPGWTATEIHRALNETRMSEATESDLWRVGRALGEREGTVAEDDPLARRLTRMGRTRAFAEGHTEGMEEGRVQGGWMRDAPKRWRTPSSPSCGAAGSRFRQGGFRPPSAALPPTPWWRRRSPLATRRTSSLGCADACQQRGTRSMPGTSDGKQARSDRRMDEPTKRTLERAATRRYRERIGE